MVISGGREVEQVKNSFTEEQKRYYLYVHSLIGTYRSQLELWDLPDEDALDVLEVIYGEEKARLEGGQEDKSTFQKIVERFKNE